MFPYVKKYTIQDDDDREYFASLCDGLRRSWVTYQLPVGSQVYIVPSPLGLAVRAFAKMSRYSPDEAELKVLCTPVHAQGKGHAKLLLSTMEDLARTKGYKMLRIESVPDAVPFYKSLGYEVGEVDAETELVLMKKQVAQQAPSGGTRKTKRRLSRKQSRRQTSLKARSLNKMQPTQRS